MVSEPIHQLPSGRWELRYRDPLTNATRRKRVGTKREARDFLADLRGHARSGTWTSPEHGKVTFSRWVDEWWGTVVHLRPGTRARYERDLRLHVVPCFGRKPLATITPRDVRAWMAGMLADGAAPSAVRRRFSVFRKIMNDAVAMEMLARTPCRGVRPPADTQGDIKVLTADEVRELAAVIHPWFRVWVWTAAYTGVRWSEMLGLRRVDLDLLHRKMVIRRQLVEVKGQFHLGEPKTAAGKRTIDLPAFLCDVLSEQLERAQPGPDGLVFVSVRGKSPHASTFANQWWRDAREAIGRPDLRWHDLRHTAVALAIAQGAHPKAIQERMGHASITMTLDRYGHLFPSLGLQIAEGLDAAYRDSLNSVQERASVASLRDAEMTQLTRG